MDEARPARVPEPAVAVERAEAPSPSCSSATTRPIICLLDTARWG